MKKSMRTCALPISGLMFFPVLLRISQAQLLAPSPSSAPAQPPSSNDSTAIDQAIAYFLLLVALALTYLLH
ncbi:hypothetical protein Ancab_016785 [Ancistrocladus abbreviatus]